MPPAAPVGPFSCPSCFAQASAAPAPQLCGACGLAFVLRAGSRVDPAIQPPAYNPHLPSIKMRSAGLVVMQSSIVAPEGVLQGSLDPITGRIPMDQSGVPFGDIVSIAIWRKLDVVRLVLLTLFLLPITLGLLTLCIWTPAVLIVALPILLLTVLSYYHVIVVRRNYARVTGSARVVQLQFDTPMRRRLKFHSELMRRAGLPESAIP